MSEQAHGNGATGQLIPIGVVAERLGRTKPVLRSYRKRGWLETVDIAGRVFVSQAALDRFVARAEAGEFSRKAQATAA